TMTRSPGQGGASHRCIRGSLMLVSSFSSSINNKLRSTYSAEPCFKIFAGNSGNTIPAMRTPILASMAAVRCAAVMINPEFRYTPEPVCSPFRIIAAVAIQGPPLSFRSAPLDMIGAKSAPARQRANAKRTLSSPCRKQDHLGHLSAPWAQGSAEEGAGRLESARATIGEPIDQASRQPVAYHRKRNHILNPRVRQSTDGEVVLRKQRSLGVDDQFARLSGAPPGY